MDSFLNVTQQLLSGFGENCYIFIVTLLLAIPLGLIVSMGSMSGFKPLKWLTKTVVWIIRGTPLMLQLFVVFYIPPLVSNGSFAFPRMNAALIAFVINYACYFAEIYRAGFESIPHGQYEACKVLGYTNVQTFFHIICPQVIKRIVPPMGNEVMTLVKDTALVKVISVIELLSLAEKHSNALVSIVPLFIAGLFYLVMNGIVSFGFNKLERKLSYYK